ncbi:MULTISPECIES: hypothetical protein [Streptomyces]|uniref:Uncharacterized protein n=1 Tax=Streptomyces tsukubensis (strain DSM 42081 / NBRC 108919 / NRRL 18488 / 9993) TaxID=1114943 RepID=I2MSY5_STRT9|nr:MULTISPECIES: hypothetical protein [Streptomyces]AZK98799.1 hypothetical protein B7R87_33090 [Streptomyces tsukubensis]EIF87882.1 hypothetical protein [Streptomyces tsukubensis NRRL18488]MYS66011.1 hypothetical protein [Streptomyces sp. SID5473]QKM65800.1 hypothetical protein STSU_000135 [Streptomyces tsukubensis NRRL18488]
MSSLRIMDSDPGKAQRTADAVQRALEASPEVVLGNVSVVPNRRDGGARVFMEVLLLEAPAAPGDDDQEVTVERADRPRPRTSRRSLPRGGRGEVGA